MKIKITLKNENYAYADPENGAAISGGGPIEVDLTQFVCGLIYRGEVKIYETVETKLESGEETYDTMPWNQLKEYATNIGIKVIPKMKKPELIKRIKEIKGEEIEVPAAPVETKTEGDVSNEKDSD